MRLGRRAIVLAALGAVALAAAAIGALLLADDESPARGDLIAYSCREPGNEWFAVCVVGPDGAGAQQLTEGLPTSDPAWSPDGRTIVFTTHVDRGEYTKVAQDDLFLVSADGGKPRQLTRTHFGRSSGDAAWSPDGNRIAFVRGSAVVDPGVLFGAIFVANADGSDVRRLTSGPRDTDPAWSPDGKEIAFARASGVPMKAEIHVLDVAAGESRGLTRATPHHLTSGPTWSPDGSTIAFVATTLTTAADGKSAIFVMKRDGTGVRRLATLRHFDRFPGNLAWSPDSDTIALVTSPSFDCSAIALLDVRTGRQRPLTSCSGVASWADSPAWQPSVG